MKGEDGGMRKKQRMLGASWNVREREELGEKQNRQGFVPDEPHCHV